MTTPSNRDDGIRSGPPRCRCRAAAAPRSAADRAARDLVAGLVQDPERRADRGADAVAQLLGSRAGSKLPLPRRAHVRICVWWLSSRRRQPTMFTRASIPAGVDPGSPRPGPSPHRSRAGPDLLAVGDEQHIRVPAETPPGRRARPSAAPSGVSASWSTSIAATPAITARGRAAPADRERGAAVGVPAAEDPQRDRRSRWQPVGHQSSDLLGDVDPALAPERGRACCPRCRG